MSFFLDLKIEPDRDKMSYNLEVRAKGQLAGIGWYIDF